MNTDCKPKLLSFQPLNSRDVTAAFDGGSITSDAGALLLRQIEAKHSIIKNFALCFTDYRDPGRIEHSITELLTQRILGICLGYEDLNDHDTLRHDPLLAVACSKADPLGKNRTAARDRGMALAGKSTLNRLELSGEGDLGGERYKKIEADFPRIENYFAEMFLRKRGSEPKEIILDCDTTDDVIHGNQEGRFFHGYYDCYCYLPLYIFCGNDLLAAKQRSCNIDASKGTREELERIVGIIRAKWKKTKIIVRGDGGFCRNEIMDWCEKNGVFYIFGLARNKRLTHKIRKQMRKAKLKFAKTKRPAREFREFSYRTRNSWSANRRVIAKAEYLAKGENPRFIVTNIVGMSARTLYEREYCARGEMENRIKEQQLHLFADRTSTETMRGNQLRLWFSCVAYVAMNWLRDGYLAATEFAKSTCESIRLKFLKIGAQIRVSVRRIYISLSESCPLKDTFTRIAQSLRL